MARSRTPLAEPEFLDLPPGWFFHGLVVLVAACTLWASSMPGFQPIIVLWAPVALLWVARVTIYNYRHLRADRRLVARSRLHWSMAPAIGIPVFLLAWFGLPLRLRFHWSRPAFEQAATEVMSSPEFTQEGWKQQTSVRIGLYEVAYRDAIPEGPRFMVAGDLYSFGWTGFARFPNGPPAPASGDNWYEPLVDEWYVWNAF